MFARRSLIAFIDILGAIDTLVAGGTGAGVGTINGTGIAYGIRVTRIRGACIVQMTQQTSLTGRAAAIEASNAIDARGAIEARSLHTIIDVLATIASCPAVYTDATVATVRVRAGCTILTDRRTQCALVDIHIAVASREIRWTIAAILVDAVHAGATVLAQISRAIIDVLIAVLSLEACRYKKREQYRVAIRQVNTK